MKKNLLLAGLVAVCTPIWAADTLGIVAKYFESLQLIDC